VEHVAFLIEESGVLIRCLLNPETLVVRRLAGVRTLRPAAGRPAGPGSLDDPVFFTGGGRTELDLDLLFDIDLPGSSPPAANVRDLTGPIWQLAENSADSQGTARPPQVRFMWGKAWNIPGVVLSIAERFDSFTSDGIPRRSWLRMRFLRVSDAPHPAAGGTARGMLSRQQPDLPGESSSQSPGELSHIYQPLSHSRPEAAPPSASFPGLVEPSALLAQALHKNPAAMQALKAADQALGALSDVLAQENLSTEAGAALKDAVKEMQAAVQTLAPGSVLPSLPAAVVRIGAAGAAAEETLSNLPSEQPGVEASRKAINELDPALNQLGMAQTEIAEDVQQSAAIASAASMDQISTAAETALEEMGARRTAAPPPDSGYPEPQTHQPETELAGSPAEIEGGAPVEGEPCGPPEVEPAQPTDKHSPVEDGCALDLPEALKRITESAQQIKVGGYVPQAYEMLEQLNRLAPQLSTAWSTFNYRPARRVLQDLAVAIHNLRAAEAACQAVSPGALLSGGLTELRASLAQLSPAQAELPRAALGAVRRLEAVARIILKTATLKLVLPDGVSEREAVLEAAAQVRSELPRLRSPEDSQAAAHSIQNALAQLDAVVKRRQEAEAEQTAMRVRAASILPGKKAGILDAEWYSPVERLDQIAFRHYGNPAYWRLMAHANQINNPLKLEPNQPLIIPPKP
jgi:hypothetical protein